MERRYAGRRHRRWALQPAITRLGDDLVVFYNTL